MLVSGQLIISVNGFPAVSIDCTTKMLEVESSGMKLAGIPLTRIVRIQGGVKHLLSESEETAKNLAQEGWTLTLYDKGSKALAMGSKVSRLTGHIRVNLLKLRGLLREST